MLSQSRSKLEAGSDDTIPLPRCVEHDVDEENMTCWLHAETVKAIRLLKG